MARPSKLSSMSVKALFKLRDDVAKAIHNKAADLQRELSALRGGQPKRGRPTGRKVAPQFRSKKDRKLTWSGRGATPALDESRNEGHEAHQGKIPDQIGRQML